MKKLVFGMGVLLLAVAVSCKYNKNQNKDTKAPQDVASVEEEAETVKPDKESNLERELKMIHKKINKVDSSIQSAANIPQENIAEENQKPLHKELQTLKKKTKKAIKDKDSILNQEFKQVENHIQKKEEAK